MLRDILEEKVSELQAAVETGDLVEALDVLCHTKSDAKASAGPPLENHHLSHLLKKPCGSHHWNTVGQFSQKDTNKCDKLKCPTTP